jgi:hypothetical protein
MSRIGKDAGAGAGGDKGRPRLVFTDHRHIAASIYVADPVGTTVVINASKVWMDHFL